MAVIDRVPRALLTLCVCWLHIRLSTSIKRKPFFTRPPSNVQSDIPYSETNEASDGIDYGWETAPWLDDDHSLSMASILEASKYEQYPQVFSPTGRLHFVEAAMKAARTRTWRSNVVIGLHCRDGLVVVSTVSTPPYLNTTTYKIDSNADDDKNHQKKNQPKERSLFLFNDGSYHDTIATTVPIFEIHPCIVGATGGNAADGQALRDKLLECGLDVLYSHGPSEGGHQTSIVARMMADKLQKPTQNAGKLLASTALVLGSHEIWRIDPTGQFWKCHAAVAGADSHRIEEILYQKIVDASLAKQQHQEQQEQEVDSRQTADLDPISIPSFLQTLSSEEALKLACDCLLERFVELLPPQQRRNADGVSPTSSSASPSSTDESTNTSPELLTESSSSMSASLESPEEPSSQSNESSQPRAFWCGAVLGYRQDDSRTNNKPSRRMYKGTLTP